jgi:hypothetical protein
MSGFSIRFGSLLLTASLCVPGLASTVAAQKGGVRKRPKKQQKQEQKQEQNASNLPRYTPAPLQPVPLDQVPAVAPHVNYEGGKLTIEAHNSTLADVLKEVREQTGAELDIPANANERVVADLGPGRARDVLADLLNGTHFNYVMVGSITDPTAIQSIVLTPRSGAADTAPAVVASRPGIPQRFPSPVVVNGTPAEFSAAADSDAADDADAADDPPTTEQADQNQQNPAQQTPKTPEQLLQELQKQQQQLQQQQQNPQSGQPPQGVLPNQPPTGAAPTPAKPE